MSTSTKPAHLLSMRDRLSHLSFEEACKMLGPEGGRLLIRGGRLELVSPDDLRIDDTEARVRWSGEANSKSSDGNNVTPSSKIVCHPAGRSKGLREKLAPKVAVDASGTRRFSIAVPPRETLAALARGLMGLLLPPDEKDHAAHETGTTPDLN